MSKLFRHIFLFVVFYLILLISKALSCINYFRFIKKNPKKLLYFAAFWPGNAGYEYRVNRWVSILQKQGYAVDVDICISKTEFDIWFLDNSIWLYILPTWRRVKRIMLSGSYSNVIVCRELLLYNEYGNLFAEKLLCRIHPNAILDFDDDISAAKNDSVKISFYGKLMQQLPSKFLASTQLYRNYFPGSNYLAARFVLSEESKNSKYFNRYLVLPTCVDYEQEAYRDYNLMPVKERVKLGWIGSTGNFYLLKAILDDLNRVSQVHDIELVVISGEDFVEQASFPIINLPWSMNTQLESLRKIDIGLMPVFDDFVGRGKCGFKLIQYMGLGIVSVASAVTVNKDVIDDNINGFLVNDPSLWFDTLVHVINSKEKFPRIGLNARIKIEEKYSFKAHEDKFIKFIKEVSYN